MTGNLNASVQFTKEYHDELQANKVLIGEVKKKVLPENFAVLFASVLRDSVEQLIILGKFVKIPFLKISLQYVPLEQRFEELNERIFIQDDSQLNKIKFQKDRTFIEFTLKSIISSLLDDNEFTLLETFIEIDKKMTQEVRDFFVDVEKSHILYDKILHEISLVKSQYSKIKKLMNDISDMKNEIANHDLNYKLENQYVDSWVKSKAEQCHAHWDGLQREKTQLIAIYSKQVEQEVRIHNDLMNFMTEIELECKQQIYDWSDRYDQNIEVIEEDINRLKFDIATQQRENDDKKKLVETRQREMDDYLEYKDQCRKVEEELRILNRAATIIQAWWRGTMFRKKIGPYSKKKKQRKGKKGALKRK